MFGKRGVTFESCPGEVIMSLTIRTGIIRMVGLLTADELIHTIRRAYL
jgi:hypothetical protein